MATLREWLVRLWGTLRRNPADRDLEQELRLHLELAAEDADRGAGSPVSAREARIRAGGIAQAMEMLRDQRGLPWLTGLARTVRYGCAMLAKNPGFAVVSVLSLALGLGVNAAIFSMTREVLLRPLPYRDADRLVRVFESSQAAAGFPVAPANYVVWRQRVDAFEQTSIFRRVSFNVAMTTMAVQVEGFQVDSVFFQMLGIVPAIGRGFTDDDTQVGRDSVVLLSDGFWRRQFGGSPAIVGQSILVDGMPCTVVGVLPSSFRIYRVLNRELDLFRPLVLDPTDREQSLNVYAKLKPAASLDLARAQMATAYASLPTPNHLWTAGAGLLSTSFSAKGKSILTALQWAVVLVLCIACANIANLLLAASAGRRKELALRQALGGSRWRVARDLSGETLVLTTTGSVLAIVLATWIVAILNAAVSFEDISRLHPFRVDIWVVAVTAGLAIGLTIIFSLLPAYAADGIDIVAALKDASHGATAGPSNRRLRHVLIVGEIALSIVLTASALALVRSALRLHNLPRGFTIDHVMTGQVALNDQRYVDPGRLLRAGSTMLDRLSTSPGIADAALVNYPPLSLIRLGVPVSIKGLPPVSADETPYARYWVVSPNYFRTIGIPILVGRDFIDADDPLSSGVAIVSEAFAQRFWHRTDVIGSQLQTAFPQSTAFWVPRARRDALTVIGVVGDVREDGLVDATDLPQLYLPYAQNPTVVVTLVARTTGGPAGSASMMIREAVRTADPQAPVSYERSLDAVIQEAFAGSHSMAWLVGAFAGLALMLAAVGVYGVMAYLTAARAHEIGIRMALGATRADIMSLIVGQAAKLTMVGVVIGIVLAPVVLSLMSGLLFGVSPLDPVLLLTVVALLSGVSLTASLIPAFRASRFTSASFR